ncbi:MAG: molybdate ABC transporter permease subunit [Sphingomonadales bacterium]|nr:molybdate ABC transporter permease subunit [Sphingomonadales bacterium]
MFELTSVEVTALLLSLKVAFTALLFGLPIAIATAWLLANKNFFGKSVIDGLIHAPLVLPPVIVGYLLLLGFGPNAALGQFFSDVFGISFAFNWKGAALASGIMAFPLMVRAIRLSMESQNLKLVKAANSLGASPTKAFFTITLPLAFPGIISGGILGFARALGEFGATISFVASIPALTQTLPLALFRAIETPGGEDSAFRLMVISLAIAMVALALSEVLARAVKRKQGGQE